MPGRVLIIDDDPLILKLCQRALRDYSTVTAASGEEGLDLYARQPFDAVICDISLPGIQGFEVIQRIRQMDASARVLVISGQETQARLIASLRENVVDFLSKPFEIDDLLVALENILASEEAVEVVSATPKWIELKVAASFQVVSRLGKFFDQLHAEIDQKTREDISTVFRELLNNAIEHGCEGDARRRISICYLRLGGVLLYRITDPGRGFKLASLSHAAVGNPQDDPLRHVQERMARGMRGGGFGILWARGIADELVYNEQGNEVVFARYLDETAEE